MIITISGYPGSGKTTVGQIVAKSLGYEFVSMGDFRGKMAMERGLTIDQLNELGRKEDWTDRDADRLLQDIGRNRDKIVIDGRLGYHFIPRSVKVLLKVDYREGARRIFLHERKDENYSTLEETEKAVKERIENDRKRYKMYYGIGDCYREDSFDLVIDTSKITAKQAAQKVLEFLKNQQNEKVRKVRV
jgi:predicted cytidylate kinase